jgi:hypothetical protein
MANVVVYPYLSPRLVEVLAPDTEITIQELVDLIRDWEDDDRNMSMSFDSLISAAGKEDLGGGVFVGITATLENTQVLFSPRSLPKDDGTGRTCDATDLNGRQLYVDDATFVSDSVVRGDLVYNVTTGGSATILEVVDENTINHLELSGGTNDDWTLGDEYIVFEVVQCNISGGNLVAVDDMDASISPVLQTFGTQIVRTSSSSATLTETQEIRDLTYLGEVLIDTIDGNPGTNFPIGNQSNAVSNLADAIIIENRLDFKKFRIRGSITLTQGFTSYSFFSFGGHGTHNVDLGNQNVDNSSFVNFMITGIQNGGTAASFEGCLIDGITGLNGTVENSAIKGTITLAVGSNCVVDKSHSNVPGPTRPVIDFNGGANTTLQLRQYSGGVTLENMTDAGNVVSADINTGTIEVAASCTAGTVVVRGDVELIDNSGVGCTVIKRTSTDLVWNAQTSDYQIAGSTGEAVSAGGALSPTQATQLKELWQILGLDVANPLTMELTQHLVDSITLDITCNPDDSVTIARQ